MKVLYLTLCAAVAVTGCSGDSHVKVKLSTNPAWPNIPELRITAVDQDVTIKGVEVNGGDCDLNPLERFPQIIPRGMTAHIDIKSDCDNVSKATIKTGDGNYKFTF